MISDVDAEKLRNFTTAHPEPPDGTESTTTYIAQLQQQAQELQELKRLHAVVWDAIAHELHTSVMGSVMVLNQMLQQPEDLITLPRSTVERMLTGSDRQLQLISSLLETHHHQEQGVAIQPEPVQFNALIEAIAEDLTPLLAEHQAHLTYEIPENLPAVMVDPLQIQRVLEHLLIYRLKRNSPGLNLQLTVTLEEGQLRCSLQDNGVKMSQLESQRLFELQIRSPQSCCSAGLGVKLYLAQKIITAHKGQIGITHPAEGGVMFWFTLAIA